MLFDDIFREIGELKLGQIMLYSILMFIPLFTGWHHVAITFLAADMPHWCNVPELANFSFSQQRDIAVPNKEDGEFDRCNVFNLNYSQFTQEDFVKWNRTEIVNGDYGIRKCDSGWVYDQSVFERTAIKQWDLVCDRAYMVSLIQTVYMAGVMVGCLVFGQLSDKIGRVKTIAFCSFFWTICAVCAAVVPAYVAFVIFRFLVGGLAAGAFTTAFVLSMEIIGPSARMATGIFVQSWFAVGIMTLSGLAYAVRDFANLQLVLGICPIIFVSYYWIVPESPRWLMTNNREKEAMAVLQMIADYNRTKLPENLSLEDNKSEGADNSAVLIDLFKTPRMRIITICMWVAWLTTSITYFGLSLGVSLLEGDLFFNNFLTGIVEIPSYILSIFALKYIGRRWPTIVTFLAAGLFNLLSIPFLTNTSMQDALITMNMLGKAFGSACFAILYVFSAELFPTVLRNVGVGSSSMMARVGGLIQPQVALIDNVWAPGPFVIYGVLSVVGALVSLAFPETRNKKLPETLEEAENFGKKQPLPTDPETAKQNPNFEKDELKETIANSSANGVIQSSQL